jgi:hypothetical protein
MVITGSVYCMGQQDASCDHQLRSSGGHYQGLYRAEHSWAIDLPAENIALRILGAHTGRNDSSCLSF